MTDTGARQSARRRRMEPRGASRAPTSPPIPGRIGPGRTAPGRTAPGRAMPPTGGIGGYPLALVHPVTSLDKPFGGEQE